MILVTVGTQLPFDRLISYIDEWCNSIEIIPDIFAQVGNSKFKSKYFACHSNIQPSEFSKIILECDLIVSHAGMGSILTALKYNKPLIILPRSAKLREHRNDHQFHTASSFMNTPGVYVANNKEQLFEILSNRKSLNSGKIEASPDYDSLISFVQSEINLFCER